MAVTTSAFVLFVIFGAFVYYIFPKKARWIVLLMLSYGFYISGGIKILGYLLFTTLTTYIFGLLIGNVKDDDKKRAKLKRRAYAFFALVLNFGLLYFVKYWNFTLDLFKVPQDILRFDLVLPLGISFYIFQSMGYIIDLTRKKYPPEKNPFKFALFVSFFPQITQGPIGRFNELSPQLYRGNELSYDNIKEGVKLSFWGFFKKLVIADRASVIACAVIDNYTSYSGSVILFGVIFYCIQLYCDFSGGIDIVRGVAQLYGVKMAENFRRPLFATSLADFWRRWHITLGAWLKDYLFYPLSFSKLFIKIGKTTRKYIKGKAGKIIPTSLATFLVYFVIGIWHGASWKYILFGLWNGVIITASLLLEPVFLKIKNKLNIKDSSLWFKIFSIVRTNIIVVMGRYITRASGVFAATDMLLRTFFNFSLKSLTDGTLMTLGLSGYDFLVVLIGVALIFVLEFFEEAGIRLTEKTEKNAYISFLFIFASVLLFIITGVFRGDYIASEFIYKQF